jgi:hypothetical protein
MSSNPTPPTPHSPVVPALIPKLGFLFTVLSLLTDVWDEFVDEYGLDRCQLW